MFSKRKQTAVGAFLSLCMVAMGLMALSAPAIADEVPAKAVWTQEFIKSGDGTMLHADILRPKGYTNKDKTPVILSIGPYYGSGAGSFPVPTPNEVGPIMRFPELFTEGKIMERGYTWVQVDLRGFGGSQGCGDLGGPGEQMDVKAAVEWAAKQPWSTGKVGMWGKSYDAWTQTMALATKPKGLAAAVIQSPIIEGYRTFYMNGVHYDSGWYATPGLYAGYDLTPNSRNASPESHLNAITGTATNPHCYAGNQAGALMDDPSNQYWKDRELIKRAKGSKTPVLFSHGFNDANTKPDNFMDIWSDLRGPKRAWFGQYDHVRGNEANLVGREGFLDEAMRWFDRYLKGNKKAGVEKDPGVEVQQGDGKWRAEKAWSPLDAKRYTMPVKAGTYVDEDGNSADGSSAGNGTWSVSQKLPYDVHLAGVTHLTAKVETLVPNAHLVGLLYDIDNKGVAKVITRGAYLIREAGKVSFDLYPQDWRLEQGHRLGVLLSGSDDSWFMPGVTGTDVTVTGGDVTMPFLRYDRDNFLKGGPATAMSTRQPFAVDAEVLKTRGVKAKLPPKLKG
ncbi:MAG TPA: CocE/NonD family hydrolase [Actinomycetota bacterium]|nr:CocE/NonD family hydrolase [Actinomycetota bacterium]